LEMDYEKHKQLIICTSKKISNNKTLGNIG
jgi:hypothetical protein